jgi:hypothetical protein
MDLTVLRMWQGTFWKTRTTPTSAFGRRRSMKTRKTKQAEAAVRQDEYDALTTEQKIARAQSRRGESKKELRRLNEQV